MKYFPAAKNCGNLHKAKQKCAHYSMLQWHRTASTKSPEKASTMHGVVNAQLVLFARNELFDRAVSVGTTFPTKQGVVVLILSAHIKCLFSLRAFNFKIRLLSVQNVSTQVVQK